MPKITLYKDISHPKELEIFDFIEYLEKNRDGEWEDLVTYCRLIKDESEKKEFKKRMPTASLSGEFSYRSDEGILEHSGYLNVDLDDLENLKEVKAKLCKDKFVFSCFMSTGGRGLRVIFKIDPLRHRDAFIGVSAYLKENYDLISDPNGINVSKPYIVSFDPGLYINPDMFDVPVFKKYVKEIKVKNIPSFIHTPTDFNTVAKEIIARQINVCENYSDWIKIGFAISEGFGEDGRSIFHDISKISLKYKFSVTDKQYSACIKSRGSSTANISSFYYIAKINGVKIVTEQTKSIIRTTVNGKKAGLKKEQIIANLAKENISNSEGLVEKVFDSEDDSSYDGDESSMIEQLEMFISNNYEMRMNDVTGFIENNGKVLSPSDLNSVFIAAKKLIPKIDYQLMIRLLKSDFIPCFNPFCEFFDSDGHPTILPPVPDDDKIVFESPLIDKLAASISNEKPGYTLFFLRKWIVSVISAAHKVHSPLLLCLIGPQYSGKTEFLRRILPKELKRYYAESKLDKGKDDEILMTENLIIMDDELGGKSKQDSQKIKNITSAEHFYLRRPYGDHNEKILRLAVLCGTTNVNEIMTDTTGNRRIIPIDVLDVNRVDYNSIDKKELWMEAYKLYRQGFDWRITPKDNEYLNKDKEKYEAAIKEREIIIRYFEPGTTDMLTSTDFVVEIEELTRQKVSVLIIGRELKSLGFEKKGVRINKYSTTQKWMVNRINRFNSSDGYRGNEAVSLPEEDLPF